MTPEEGIARAVRALVDVGSSFVLLARDRLRSDPEQFERKLTQPLRRLFERGQAAGDIRDGHHERSADRVADRADRRRASRPRRRSAGRT